MTVKKQPPTTAAAAPDWADYLDFLGFPGQAPFVRGIHASMYRSRFWTMRQYAGFGDAADTNARFRYLLGAGQTALSTAFDLPTQMGLDSDHDLAGGEIGRVGVAIDTPADLDLLFDAIPLAKVSTSMTINATASTLLAYYLIAAERQGVAAQDLRGTLQNDLLKEFVARGTYIFPPAPSMRLVTDVIEYCEEKLPKWYPISVSGYHMREAGATALQELAFTFANGLEYLRACDRRGLDVRNICRRLSFFFSVDNNFLEEVSKFRAARGLWHRLLTRHFPAVKGDAKAAALRFHVQTGGSTLTAQQPHNNIVRVTLQALAAVLGGAQSLHTNAFDEALALPTEASALLALRTQQIVAHESGVTDTVDPVAGSVAIEECTHALMSGAEKMIEEIDGLGGALAAIEDGYFQDAIGESAYVYQQTVERGEQVIVGLNRFEKSGNDRPPALWEPRVDLAEKQLARLESFRRGRRQAEVGRTLDELTTLAAGQHNLMPAIIAAAKQGCTLGEISSALRKVFGTYRGAHSGA